MKGSTINLNNLTIHKFWDDSPTEQTNTWLVDGTEVTGSYIVNDDTTFTTSWENSTYGQALAYSSELTITINYSEIQPSGLIKRELKYLRLESKADDKHFITSAMIAEPNSKVKGKSFNGWAFGSSTMAIRGGLSQTNLISDQTFSTIYFY